MKSHAGREEVFRAIVTGSSITGDSSVPWVVLLSEVMIERNVHDLMKVSIDERFKLIHVTHNIPLARRNTRKPFDDRYIFRKSNIVKK